MKADKKLQEVKKGKIKDALRTYRYPEEREREKIKKR